MIIRRNYGLYMRNHAWDSVFYIEEYIDKDYRETYDPWSHILEQLNPVYAVALGQNIPTSWNNPNGWKVVFKVKDQ